MYSNLSYMSEITDVQTALNLFIHTFTTIVDKYASLRRIRIKDRTALWFFVGTFILI